MQKILFLLVLIVSGLIFGYLWQQLAKKRGPGSETSIPAIRKWLQKISLLYLLPISFVAAVWVISFQDMRIFFLPALCAGGILLGGVLGLAVATFLKKDGRQKGALFCCGSFSNMGLVGALVAFVFLDETGFGLLALYRMFEEVIYYTVGFPIAKYYSGAEHEATFWKRILQVSKDPFVRTAIGSFTCGLVLNLSGIPRPPFFEIVNSFVIPISTFILLVSIGLGMRFSRVGGYLVEGLLVSAIKFIAIPLVVGITAYAMGFGGINNGLPLRVVIIASSMPVAFTALAAASIYDLDLNLANSCWLITTGSLVIVLPWLFFLMTII